MSSDRKRKLDLEVEAAPKRASGFTSAPAISSTVNPYTGRPYSQKYYEILDKRQGGYLRRHAAERWRAAIGWRPVSRPSRCLSSALP